MFRNISIKTNSTSITLASFVYTQQNGVYALFLKNSSKTTARNCVSMICRWNSLVLTKKKLFFYPQKGVWKYNRATTGVLLSKLSTESGSRGTTRRRALLIKSDVPCRSRNGRCGHWKEMEQGTDVRLCACRMLVFKIEIAGLFISGGRGRCWASFGSFLFLNSSCWINDVNRRFFTPDVVLTIPFIGAQLVIVWGFIEKVIAEVHELQPVRDDTPVW